MKLLLISGSYPPQVCGVGDYTNKLLEALTEKGLDVFTLEGITWSVYNYFNIIKRIEEINPNIIHIQYPSVGYGFSVVPQLISIRYRTIVTIHEVIHASALRKVSLMPFSIKSSIIFTNIYEKQFFEKKLALRKICSAVIPIGSNISIGKHTSFIEKNKEDIICFGLIRPNKGIEQAIECAKEIKDHNLNYQVVIVGQVPEKMIPYFEDLKIKSHGLPVLWQINLLENDVSEILSKTLIAYLPIPDGVSEMRGSVLAALSNDMLLFTTKGNQTTEELTNVTEIVHSPSEFVLKLKSFNEFDIEALWAKKRNAVKDFVDKFSWNSIVAKHINVYNEFQNIVANQ